MWIKLNSIESIGTSINSVEVSLVQWCKFAMPPAWNATLDSIRLIPLLDSLPDGVDYALPLQFHSTALGKLSNSWLKLFRFHRAWMFCFTSCPRWMESAILVARLKAVLLFPGTYPVVRFFDYRDKRYFLHSGWRQARQWPSVHIAIRRHHENCPLQAFSVPRRIGSEHRTATV